MDLEDAVGTEALYHVEALQQWVVFLFHVAFCAVKPLAT